MTTVATTRSLDVALALDAMDRLAPRATLVLQGNLERATTFALAEAARFRALRVAFNPSPWMAWSAELVAHAHAVFVNEGEAHAATGAADGAAVARLLRMGPEAVVLTRGACGALLGTRDGAGEEATARGGGPRPPTSSTPPGRGTPTSPSRSPRRRPAASGSTGRALEHAARAAAITVSRHGTVAAFPTVAELAAVLGRERARRALDDLAGTRIRPLRS